MTNSFNELRLLLRSLLSFDLLVSLGVAVFAATASAEPPPTPDDIQGPKVWGAARNVTHYENLWFSGQPDRAGLEAAKNAGVSVVVNLRHPSELDWDEEAAAEGLGLAYYNVPVVGTEPISRETFTVMDALIAQHQSEQVLVHCSSSNRVGAWFTAHLVTQRGLSLEDAIEVGRKTGLTKEPLVEKVRTYLEGLSKEVQR